MSQSSQTSTRLSIFIPTANLSTKGTCVNTIAKKEDLFSLINYISTVEGEEKERAVTTLRQLIGNEIENFFESQVYVKSQIEMLKDLKHDVSERIKTYENQLERLEEFALYNLKAMEMDKLKSDLTGHYIEWKVSETVDVFNEDIVPTGYDKKQERQIDIAKVRKALLSGITVPGAQLKQTEYGFISSPKSRLPKKEI